jgi:hypothetical protein
MNSISIKMFMIPLLLFSMVSAAAEKERIARKPIELADLVVGTYYGDVISDSKGSSRSDVIPIRNL